MSNQLIHGVVDRTWTKTKSTSKGDKIINYASVDGVEFSTGFQRPFSEGEMVNIVVKFNYGELQYQPNVSPSGVPAYSASAPTKGNFGGQKQSNKGGYGNKGTFPVSSTDGQMSIIRQSSMNRAVEIMEQLMNSDIFSPRSEDEYMKKLLEVALIVTDFGSGNDIMQMMAAKAANREASNG
jgi:hypothetical protein